MRVAIYARLSDEDRDKENPLNDSESIKNQILMLSEHAASQGWALAGVYRDDDYSGADRDRPDFNRMLRDAERGRFDIVLCKSQARFSRELEIVEKYIHGKFTEWGIRYVSLADYADTDNKGNKKSRQINGLVNEWFLEDLSENVTSVLNNKRSRGEYISSFALYGYRKDEKDNNKLVIDEPAARIIRRIYRQHREGLGILAIAKRLNDEGIPNPTWYKKEAGYKVMTKSKANTSSHWSPNTVRGILANQMYAGTMVQGKQKKLSYKSSKLIRTPRPLWFVVKGTHEAIIDRQEWEATQRRLAQRARMRKDGTVRLLAGKTFCASCGAALHANASKGVKYLRCPTGQVSKGHCGGCRLRSDDLEARVLERINNLARQYYDEAALVRNITIRNITQEQLKECENELKLLLSREEELSNAALELYMDKMKGVVSEPVFKTVSNRLSREAEQTAMRKEALEKQLITLKAPVNRCQDKTDIVRKYSHFDSLTRALVNGFVNRVEVGRKDTQTKRIPVKITWNF